MRCNHPEDTTTTRLLVMQYMWPLYFQVLNCLISEGTPPDLLDYIGASSDERIKVEVTHREYLACQHDMLTIICNTSSRSRVNGSFFDFSWLLIVLTFLSEMILTAEMCSVSVFNHHFSNFHLFICNISLFHFIYSPCHQYNYKNIPPKIWINTQTTLRKADID